MNSKQIKKLKFMLYRLTTSKGMYDDYCQIDIGTYTTNELAQAAKELFLLEVQKIKDANPCPVTPEIVQKIQSYDMEEKPAFAGFSSVSLAPVCNGPQRTT